MRRDFVGVLAVAHAAGSSVLTFLVPSQIWRDESYPLAGVHARIAAVLAPTADHFLDVTPFLMSRLGNGFDHWVLKELPDAHPDAETHRLYAQAVFAEMQRLGISQALVACAARGSRDRCLTREE